ncbi:MAG: SEC-C domain-containing protein [Bacillaceae bacterium]|nr:SEC-C domain-containing protein [Bacillaceae bacterium]
MDKTSPHELLFAGEVFYLCFISEVNTTCIISTMSMIIYPYNGYTKLIDKSMIHLYILIRLRGCGLMIKVSRNDVCPCGSGKKYKKCCGGNSVVTVGHLLDQELEAVQGDILHFAMSNYEDLIDAYLEEYYDKFDIPVEARDIFHFFALLWVIISVELSNGKTILVEYVDRNLYKHTRQKTKEIVQSWTKAKPALSIILHQEGNNYLRLKDFFTGEEILVKVRERENEFNIGGLMLSILLPSGHTKMFFIDGLDLPPEKTEKMSGKIMNLYNESGMEPTKFANHHYLELISLFIYGEVEFGAEEVEWNTPAQLEVAKRLEEEIPNFWQEEMISLGLVLWKKFCDIKNPRVQKPTLYAAGIIYLLDKLAPLRSRLTQTELAESFNISSNSVSTKYRELESVLWEDIMELQQKLFDFDDSFREDLFDEGEMVEREDDFFRSKMSLESELTKVKQLLADKEFDTIEEVNTFLAGYLNGGNIPSKTNLSNKEKAQDLIYEAIEASDMKRKKLAEKALELDPNNPDAYSLLANYEDDPEELLLQGIKAGERSLGEEYFKENKGHFWGLIETRPYMRVKFNYASYLQGEGRVEDAIIHYKELLELNPNDNQGVRFELFVAYAEEEMYEEAKRLLEQYEDTLSANRHFNRLLIELLQNGPTEKAKELLNVAKEHNPYVINYLLMKKSIPINIPGAYSPGDKNEAIIYADEHIHLWHHSEDCIQWLTQNH